MTASRPASPRAVLHLRDPPDGPIATLARGAPGAHAVESADGLIAPSPPCPRGAPAAPGGRRDPAGPSRIRSAPAFPSNPARSAGIRSVQLPGATRCSNRLRGAPGPKTASGRRSLPGEQVDSDSTRGPVEAGAWPSALHASRRDSTRGRIEAGRWRAALHARHGGATRGPTEAVRWRSAPHADIGAKGSPRPLPRTTGRPSPVDPPAAQRLPGPDPLRVHGRAHVPRPSRPALPRRPG